MRRRGRARRRARARSRRAGGRARRRARRARRCCRGRRRCSGSRGRGGRRGSSSCGALPVGPGEAARGDDALQLEHRRVRGEDDELAARRRQGEAAVERTLEVRLDLDRALVEAAVLEAQRELGRAVAGGDEPVEPGEQRLEVDVPDPGDVPPVGDRVVQARRRRGAAARRRRASARPRSLRRGS